MASCFSEFAGPAYTPNTCKMRMASAMTTVPQTAFSSSSSGYFNDPSNPPSYTQTTEYDTLLLKLPPARFPVSPREDEGHELLPKYEPTLTKSAIFDYKEEMCSPFRRSSDRAWRPAYIVLNSTVLEIYRPRRTAIFGNTMYPGESADSVCGFAPGALMKKFTLQGAQVGVAADYTKRAFVIRIRAEKEQFLFAMRSLARMIEWLEALGTAIDLSPSLEERSLPKYQTIPRRARRTPEQIVREQEEIIRRHYPSLGFGNSRGGTAAEDRDHADDIDVDAVRAQQPASAPPSVRSMSLSAATPRTSAQSLPARMHRTSTRSSSISSTASSSSSSSSSTEKWNPRPGITAHGNLMFARRCMAVLPSYAPRQSEYIVSEGKRWKIDWEAQCLVEMNVSDAGSPPKYTEVAEDEGLA